MVKECLCDTTSFASPTINTDSTSYVDVTITGTECYTHITYTISNKTDENLEKIKKLLKKEEILKMKKTWNNFKNEFYSIPPTRPAIQLRGVCLDGMGWA